MRSQNQHVGGSERASQPVYKRKKKDMYEEARILNEVIDDSRIEDAEQISIAIERLGFLKGKKIHILGTVQNEKDRSAAEEIVTEQAGKKDQVSNELTIKEEE